MVVVYFQIAIVLSIIAGNYIFNSLGKTNKHLILGKYLIPIGWTIWTLSVIYTLKLTLSQQPCAEQAATVSKSGNKLPPGLTLPPIAPLFNISTYQHVLDVDVEGIANHK